MAQFDFRRDEAAREYLRLRIGVAQFLLGFATGQERTDSIAFLHDLVKPDERAKAAVSGD